MMAPKRRDELLDGVSDELPDSDDGRISARHIRALADNAVLRSTSALHLLDFIPGSEHAKIRDGSSTYDCLPAYESAVDALPPNGGVLHLGGGAFSFDGTLRVKRPVKMIGEGKAATTLWFPKDTHGVIFGYPGAGDDDGYPAGATLEGVAVRARSKGTTGHGIRIRFAGIEIRDVTVHSFAEDGFHIVANVFGEADSWLGNANEFLLYKCLAYGNGRHGYYFDGPDANAGTVIHCDATHNGGWGFYDSSFLGNTFTGTHTAYNTLGGYKTDNANSHSVFIGAYAEGGQPDTELSARTVFIPGEHYPGIKGGLVLEAGTISPHEVRRKIGDRSAALRLNMDGNSLLSVGVTDSGPWSLAHWDENSGTMQLRWAGLDGGVPMMLTTSLSDFPGEDDENIGPGKMLLQGAWARLANGRYKFINLADLEARIAALEAG